MTTKPAYMVPVVLASGYTFMLARIEGFVKAAQAMKDAYNAKDFPNIPREILEVSLGKRYAKIVARSSNSGSAWAFVDLAAGDILKPASFNAPAKHARGTVLAADYGVGCCGPHGPRYLS